MVGKTVWKAGVKSGMTTELLEAYCFQIIRLQSVDFLRRGQNKYCTLTKLKDHRLVQHRRVSFLPHYPVGGIL